MRFSLIAFLFFGCLSAPTVHAEEPGDPPSSFRAASEIMMTFGTEGFNVLDERGFILLAGDETTGRRLLRIEQPLIAPLAASLGPAEAFLARLDAAAKGVPAPKTRLRDIRAFQDLPLGGVNTPRMRTAADLMGWELASADELDGKLEAVLRTGGLFQTPWGAELLERTHPMEQADSARAADLLFGFLNGGVYGPGPLERAAAFSKEVYGEDLGPKLEADLQAGELSAPMRSFLRRYIEDEGRLWSMRRAEGALAKLVRDPALRRDLRDLRLIVEGLRKEPAVFETAARTLKASGSGHTRFTAPELQVYNADRSGTLRVGDRAVVSIAYWVSGLSKEQTAAVTEAGFTDRGANGHTDRTLRLVERFNGGPYIYSETVPIRTSKDLIYRFFLNSPDGTTLERDVTIEVSPSYEEALDRAMETERGAFECRLGEAVASFRESADAIGENVPPQFEELKRSLSDRARSLERRDFDGKRLKNAVDGAKLYASKAECRFRGDRASRALDMLKDLPAGCDRLPEDGAPLSAALRRLARETRSRRERQEVFENTVSRARELEKSCKAEEAAAYFASALALLEAAPETRCGEPEKEHTMIRLATLPRSAAASRLAGGLDAVVSKAEERFAKEDYAGTLALVIPLTAAIDSLPAAQCYSRTREKAMKLAEAAGIALGPKDPGLPKDRLQALENQLEKRFKERVAAERAAARRERLRESPVSPEQSP